MNALLIVLFGVLQVADGVVTFFVLKFAGVDEVNPVLNCWFPSSNLCIRLGKLRLHPLGSNRKQEFPSPR